MDLTIRYVTRFVYAMPVWDSHNVLRACPQAHGDQTLLSYVLTIDPAASVFSYQDRWGTRVDTFGVRQPHDELVVTVDTTVTTSAPTQPESASLADLEAPAYRDQVWEFLQPTRHTRWSDGLAKTAGAAVAAADGDVVAAVVAIDRLVHDALEYRPGATEIGVDVDLVWDTGAGVCQDFAHLTIAMLRAVGIGARYVSGYFYASDPTLVAADDEGEIVVATHAWVEAAIPGWGWWGIDPTNTAPVGERHVKIGNGRDYDDVTPLRGVYYGDTDHHLAVEVMMSTGPIRPLVLPDVEPVERQVQQQSRQQ